MAPYRQPYLLIYKLVSIILLSAILVMDLSSSILVMASLGIVAGQGGYWWLGNTGVFGGAELIDQESLVQNNAGLDPIKYSDKKI